MVGEGEHGEGGEQNSNKSKKKSRGLASRVVELGNKGLKSIK